MDALVFTSHYYALQSSLSDMYKCESSQTSENRTKQAVSSETCRTARVCHVFVDPRGWTLPLLLFIDVDTYWKNYETRKGRT